MRKIIVSINVTLDGYLSGPDGELDWHVKRWTKEMGDALCSQLAAADTVLLGRVTYTAMAAYCSSKVTDPHCRGEDFAFANMMNCYPKIVVSKTMKSVRWNNTRLLKGNLQDKITQLKTKPGGNILVYGSSQLVTALVQLGLVDAYWLWIHPVVLGKGKLLFENIHHSVNFTTLKTETFQSGVVLMQLLVA